ncbi:unnamed protein product [Adineta ricciae]|nr:unnamed protein product [Adineta ricciae]
MILSSTLCFAELFFGSVTASIAVFSLQNDRQQRVFQDSLCVFRGYMGFVGFCLLMNSCVLQAIYRYIVIVYPTRLSWQSARVQLIAISVTCLYCFVTMLPWFLTGNITYSIDDQVCLVSLQLSVPVIYNMFMTFVFPISIIMLIYKKLVYHVQQISIRATSNQTVFQARRNFTIVSRIIIIVIILLVLGIPYMIFNFMSFFTKPSRYHLRITVLLLDVFQPLTMMVIFLSNQPVMDIIKKWKCSMVNTIQPT